MDRNLNQEQDKLFELLEDKDYHQLSRKEQLFVDQALGQEEYELQRKIIIGANEVEDNVIPAPLVLPQKKGGVIPIYQAVAAVAASVIISFFVFNSNEIVHVTNEVPQFSAADTVRVEKKIIDTVIEYQVLYRDRIIYKEAKASQEKMFADTPMQIPEFDTAAIKNKGKTILEDQTSALINDFRINGNGIGL